MTARVEHDAENNAYSLGDDIDGVFIPFASLDGPTIEGRVKTGTVSNGAREANVGEAAAAIGDENAGKVNPDDFTDNGDGTYTRKSDNVQGRFTPTGFEPITQ